MRRGKRAAGRDRDSGPGAGPGAAGDQGRTGPEEGRTGPEEGRTGPEDGRTPPEDGRTPPTEESAARVPGGTPSTEESAARGPGRTPHTEGSAPPDQESAAGGPGSGAPDKERTPPNAPAEGRRASTAPRRPRWVRRPRHAGESQPPGQPRRPGRLAGALIGVPARQAHTLLPGLILAAALAAVSMWLSDVIGLQLLNLETSPVSAVMTAIVLGLIISNVVRLPAWLTPGLSFAVGKVLRLGIIFLGIRLSLTEIARLGALGVPIVLGCILAALAFTLLLARLMGLPGKLATLIAVGTSICGVSAIVATGPAIDSREEEVAYAVSVITVFGIIATVAYPYLANAIFAGDPTRAGLFLGTAVHDTSQVTGAALLYAEVYARPAALNVAVVTKLVRNIFMALVIPFMAYAYSRNAAEAEAGKGSSSASSEIDAHGAPASPGPTAASDAATPGTDGAAARDGASSPDAATAAASPGGRAAPEATSPPRKLRIGKFFPLFILGFILFAVLRSVGDLTLSRSGAALGLFGADAWTALYGSIRSWAVNFLVVALAGVGLSTRFRKLKELGFKPFLAGLGAAVVVGAVSYLLISLLGRFVTVV